MTQQSPGRHDREGMNSFPLYQIFPGDASAEAWSVECRWPQGRRLCPI